jgi:hypothetical protein
MRRDVTVGACERHHEPVRIQAELAPLILRGGKPELEGEQDKSSKDTAHEISPRMLTGRHCPIFDAPPPSI